MKQAGTALVVVSGLFFLILLLMEVGRRAGVHRKQLDPEGVKAGLGAVEGAVFGLMGLLIAFTFSGAAERFETRRHLIVQEQNSISTAYLRVDLLPSGVQPPLRDDFRHYLDARISFYENLVRNPELAGETINRSNALQQKIWTEALIGCQQTGSPATTTLTLAALNDMFDSSSTRVAAIDDHPPSVIFWGLAILVFAGAVLAGFGMAQVERPSRLHMLLFSAILATAVYVIVDLEFPRVGLIRVNKADHLLTDLRQSMK